MHHSEITHTGIWLRENVSKLFNIARIPQKHCDNLSTPPLRPYSLSARSLLVMFHNFCYTIPVYSSQGQLASPQCIYHRLRSVVADVDIRLKAQEVAFPIGVLSADDRNIWAKACDALWKYEKSLTHSQNLQYLLLLSTENKVSHEALLNSIMALSLDDFPSSYPSSTWSREELKHYHTHDRPLRMIRGTLDNFANRFYDKPFTIVVDALTHAGATGEHSPCDALVPSIVAEYGIVQSIEEEAFQLPEGESPTVPDGEDCFTRIDWVADDQLWSECEAAKQRSISIIMDSDNSVLWFDQYGTGWIKGVGVHCFISSHLPFRTDIHYHSQIFTRCLHTNGSTTCLVPNSPRVHSNIRNCPDARI